MGIPKDFLRYDLVGKMVLVHWANDKFTFENGWFSDIEAYVPSSAVFRKTPFLLRQGINY